MRGGPSTGLPTWNEQGDLWLALHAHQGNIPNIVLAAGDPEEAFHLTTQAFNLADKYQTPVLILLDKSICEDDQSCPPFDTTGYQIDKGKLATQTADNYQRYLPTDDGISPRAFPGSGNFFIANSDEHDPTGYSDESAQNRRQQMAKRMRKLETCAQNDMPPPKIFGPENADITIVSWGSNKGSILEALKSLPNVNFLYLNWLNPFPAKDVHDRLSKAKYILNIECNYTAQMAGLIRQKTGIAVSDNLLKFDGRPIYPEEIIDKINSINPKQ
jgi:2-oxoglutarate ferredoxin oxidoreductase subunit alpha